MDIWIRRTDLEFVYVRQSESHEPYWVVKDPFSRDWHYLSEQERKLLEMADGSAGILDVCRRAQKILPNASIQSLVSFFMQARRAGLLTASGVEGPLGHAIGLNASQEIASRFRWPNLIAIRFPGWNPNRTIEDWISTLKRFVGLWVACLAFVIAAAGLIAVVGHFDRLAREWSELIALENASNWWLVLVTIAFVKVVHELAHALACKAVGAECLEMGVMLLFGAPCLYCDVSDLWIVPERWKRVFVSSAGMIAEFFLASIASLIWVSTDDTSLHTLALLVVTVCSLSTLVVNANPLLRYDGYYILSDILGVPNLAARANDQTARLVKGIFWGEREPANVTVVGRPISAFWLYLYSAASFGYRTLLVAFIALATYEIADAFGLGWAGGLIAILLFAGTLLRPLLMVLRPPASHDNQGEWRTSTSWWRHGRARVTFPFAILVAAIALAVPIPKRHSLPVVVTADNAIDIYAPSSGRLKGWSDTGDVEFGRVLMTLADDALTHRLMVAEAAFKESEADLNSLQRLKGTDSTIGERIALAQQRLESSRRDLGQIRTMTSELTIKAPIDGKFYLEPHEPAFGKGQLIRAGQLIGRVGDRQRRSGYALASQLQIADIRVGQRVFLRHPSISSRRITGTVRDVGRTPVKTVPSELDAMNPRMKKTRFAIHLEWDSKESFPLPLRSRGVASVNVGSISGWNRIQRWFRNEFARAM